MEKHMHRDIAAGLLIAIIVLAGTIVVYSNPQWFPEGKLYLPSPKEKTLSFAERFYFFPERKCLSEKIDGTDQWTECRWSEKGFSQKY
jgi:hypothetical protein